MEVFSLQHTVAAPRSSSFTARSCSTPGTLPEHNCLSAHDLGGLQASFLRQLASTTQQSRSSTDAGIILGNSQAPSALADDQHMQLQLQQYHAENQALLLQQEQLRLQEVHKLQAQLQRLLGAAPQQQLGGMTKSSSTGELGLLSNGGGAMPVDLLQQLQQQQQQLQALAPSQQASLLTIGGQDTASRSYSSFAGFSTLLEEHPTSQTSAGLSLPALGPAPAFSVAASLSAMPSSELALTAEQQLGLQPSMSVLAEAPGEEEVQVAALDGLINRCFARLQQLRQQIAVKKTVAVGASNDTSGLTLPAGRSGSFLATQAGNNGQVPDALVQAPAASTPFALLQQQGGSMLGTSPVTGLQSAGGGVSCSSTPPAYLDASLGNSMSATSSMRLSASGAPLSGPVLLQQQVMLPRVAEGQQHQQELYYQSAPPTGSQQFAASNDGSNSAFSFPTRSDRGQGFVLMPTGMARQQQAAAAQGHSHVHLSGGDITGQLDMQQLQELIARQQLQGMPLTQ